VRFVKPKSARPPAAPQKNDRRTGVDRRRADIGPPKGVRDRRVSVEPRMPEVKEVHLSPSEWGAFEDAAPSQQKKPPPTS
jgi:hypothetical protein